MTRDSPQQLRRVIRFPLGKRDWSKSFPAAGSMQVIDMYKDSSAADAVENELGSERRQSLEEETVLEQCEVNAKRLQLYKTAEGRKSVDLGAKVMFAYALEHYGDLGFRQRRLSKSGWSGESSDGTTTGAVRQENRDLDLECFRCDQEDGKTLKDRKELVPGYEENKTRRSQSADGSVSRDQ